MSVKVDRSLELPKSEYYGEPQAKSGIALHHAAPCGERRRVRGLPGPLAAPSSVSDCHTITYRISRPIYIGRLQAYITLLQIYMGPMSAYFGPAAN